MNQTTSILFVGDMHIGRRPHMLAEFGIDTSALAPGAVWQRVVDHAIEHKLAAVVLAGDVVDQSRDRWEAYAQLEKGAQRLAYHDIPLIGVAGNHDGIVLPRLAERMPHFTLLGRGGNWELLQLPTSPPVDLLGWSFPTRHFHENPLLVGGFDDAVRGRRTEAALLGVLHCDLDAGNSPYAPVPSAQLNAMDVDGFLLGHIHNPSALCTTRPIGYLGSMVGLHRNEAGWRGPWRLDVRGRGQLAASQVVISPLRWEKLAIDVSAIQTDGTVDDATVADAVHAAVGRAIESHQSGDPTLMSTHITAVGCTISLHGRTVSPARIRQATLGLAGNEQVTFPRGGQTWAVVKWLVDVRPEVNLGELAGHQNALGTVARLLQSLRDESGQLAPSLGRAAAAAREPFSNPRWAGHEDGPALAGTRDQVKAAAWRLLETLLSQAGGPS